MGGLLHTLYAGMGGPGDDHTRPDPNLVSYHVPIWSKSGDDLTLSAHRTREAHNKYVDTPTDCRIRGTLSILLLRFIPYEKPEQKVVDTEGFCSD